jgi:hypothetical protein
MLPNAATAVVGMLSNPISKPPMDAILPPNSRVFEQNEKGRKIEKLVSEGETLIGSLLSLPLVLSTLRTILLPIKTFFSLHVSYILTAVPLRLRVFQNSRVILSKRLD